MIQYYGTGKRKTAIARVFLRPGEGKVELIVNNRKRDFENYFSLEMMKTQIRKPFFVTETMDKFDLYITIKGGGVSAQADAIKLGIARALLKFNPELRTKLKKEGLLTRDAREKERRKYGLHKARKAPQYHKR